MSSNMSTGQLVGAGLGAIAGFFLGPAGWAATAAAIFQGAAVGMAVGGAIDPPKGPDIEGPRLADSSVQAATYGANVPRVYGRMALHGTMIWIENDRLREVLTEEKVGGKGGGGKQKLKKYTYYFTGAIALCEGPIVGISRIWLSDKLWYDAGSGDYDTVIASNQAAAQFTLYKGTDNQKPDPRMQATLGVANAPAFRGIAYIVLHDIDMTDFGSSPMTMQVKVEVVGAGLSNAPVRTINGAPLQNAYRQSSFRDGVVVVSEAEQVGSRIMLKQAVVSSAGEMTTNSLYVHDFLNMFGGYPLNAPDGGWAIIKGFDGIDGFTHLVDENGQQLFRFNRQQVEQSVGATASGGYPYCCVYNDAFYYMAFQGAMIVHKTKAPRLVRTAQLPGGVAVSSFFTGNDGALYVNNASGIYRVDPETLAVVQSYPFVNAPGASIYCIGRFDEAFYIEGSRTNPTTIYRAVPSAAGQINWADTASVKSATVSGSLVTWTIVTKDLVWASGAAGGGGRSNQLISFSDVTSSQTLALSTICATEAIHAPQLTPADLDVTGLTATLAGYKITSVAAIRGGLEPLRAAYPFDAIQSGYKIKFVKRGTAPVRTIPHKHLGATGGGDEQAPPAMTITRDVSSLLPQRVVVKYHDLNREYDINEQYVERQRTDTGHVRTLELAIAMGANEAAGMAETLLYHDWLNRYEVSFALPPEYSALEPSDVVIVQTPDGDLRIRLVSVEHRADGVIACAGRFDSAAIYTPKAVGSEGGSTGHGIALAGPMQFVLIDAPAMVSTFDSPGFVVAMSGFLGGWPGGVIDRSADAGQTWESVAASTAPGAVIGRAQAALPDAKTTAIFDKSATLSVKINAGSLASVTETQVLNGANHFLIGDDGRWEVVAAQKCVLAAANTYTLSDLLRGRFGTEWATGTHQINDYVIPIDGETGKQFVSVESSTIGLARAYRGTTAGEQASAASRDFTYRAVNLECYAPVYLNGNRSNGNNWTLTWQRRTRIGGEWRDLVDVPLSERDERYEVDIFTSSAFTTVKRTIATTTPSCAYSLADQITDFGAAQGTLYVRVYQLSELAGRGYPLQATITRS